MRIDFKKYTDDNTFSLSISDLMAALLLIFVLLLSATLLKIEEKVEQIDEREQAKKEIITRLEEEMKELHYDITVDSINGTIRVDEDILFQTGQFDLLDKGKIFLEKFIPIYSNVLLSDDKIIEHLAQIVIEGHTDTIGTYESNLKLSLNRANTVANYIILSDLDEDYKKNIQKFLSANGRSFSEPLKPNTTPENMRLNRRVEIEFRLKDYDLETKTLKYNE